MVDWNSKLIRLSLSRTITKTQSKKTKTKRKKQRHVQQQLNMCLSVVGQSLKLKKRARRNIIPKKTPPIAPQRQRLSIYAQAQIISTFNVVKRDVYLRRSGTHSTRCPPIGS